MTRNQRQGALAELDVATQLIRNGCAVNALSQMDYGTDIHVQLPAHDIPRNADSWPLSQHDARIQVKSTRQARPSFSLDRELVAGWAPTVRKTSPVFLVICWVARTRTRGTCLFTPEDFARAREVTSESITFSGSEASRVSSSELLARISSWAYLAPRADALGDAGLEMPSLFGPLDIVVATEFIEAAVMAWVEAYVPPAEVDHGYGISEVTALAQWMAGGLGIHEAGFDARALAEQWLDAPRYHGEWYDSRIPLAAFTEARGKEASHEALLDLARAWGSARRTGV